MSVVTRRLWTLGLAAFVACSLAVPVAASESPLTPVNGIYAWYFRGGPESWPRGVEGARSFLDPFLYAKLSTAVALQQKVPYEVIDFDVWANAQWPVKAFTAGTPALHGDAYWVPVTVTLERGWTTKLTMVVKKYPDEAYRVYDVIYTVRKATFDLRGYLDSAIKENRYDLQLVPIKEVYESVLNVHRDPDFHWQDHVSSVQAYLEPGLYAKVSKAVALQKTGPDQVFGFDIWTAAQDDGYDARAGEPVPHGDAYEIPVKITLEDRTTSSVIVVVKRGAGGAYQIYDIVYPGAKPIELRGYLDQVIEESDRYPTDTGEKRASSAIYGT